ncbi:hypothetical protein NLI96_g11557 [Meripilus lineatus]|uniref:Phosphatases II n=1 Tax=Meripilus lineatus TaxID=2056292 RepID=A0AAD5URJ6_9APHY|nr:hypothetical protein NLI96_g11557 [Physisporinus lineatus]
MSERQPVPKWLQEAHDADHLSDALQILQSRERTREHARTTSRHKANPSRAYRITHLPSTVLTNSDDAAHYSVAVASQPENRVSNRYGDIEPYDRTRVVVGHGGQEPSGRYLNASWVRELAGGKWWIATQAPLPATSHAFLSVLLQPISRPPSDIHLSTYPISSKSSRVRTVVQLTQNYERGMRKAHMYFPSLEGESWILPPESGCTAPSVRVTLVRLETFEHAHCTKSTVSIQQLSQEEEDLGEPVIFRHMLFSAWPDHGVPEPEDRAALLNFVHLVDETNRDLSPYPTSSQADLDSDPPIMVNCSAGVGRTGSFIAICSLLRSNGFLPPSTSPIHGPGLPDLTPSRLGALPAELKDDMVAQEIDSLREQRPCMVQRDEQALLVYETLITAFTEGAGRSKA